MEVTLKAQDYKNIVEAILAEELTNAEKLSKIDDIRISLVADIEKATNKKRKESLVNVDEYIVDIYEKLDVPVDATKPNIAPISNTEASRGTGNRNTTKKEAVKDYELTMGEVIQAQEKGLPFPTSFEVVKISTTNNTSQICLIDVTEGSNLIGEMIIVTVKGMKLKGISGNWEATIIEAKQEIEAQEAQAV